MRNIAFFQTACLSEGAERAFFIQGQALVSVISQPCCGGNAYYVVVHRPCLLWPWGLFPWRNEALQNERSDHRNHPGKEKSDSSTAFSHFFCFFVQLKQTLSHCHVILTSLPVSFFCFSAFLAHVTWFLPTAKRHVSFSFMKTVIWGTFLKTNIQSAVKSQTRVFML